MKTEDKKIIMDRRMITKLLRKVGLSYYSYVDSLVDYLIANPEHPFVKKLCTINTIQSNLNAQVYKLHLDILWEKERSQ